MAITMSNLSMKGKKMSNSEVEAAVDALIAINPDYSREVLLNLSAERLEELIEERLQEANEAQLKKARKLRSLAAKIRGHGS